MCDILLLLRTALEEIVESCRPLYAFWNCLEEVRRQTSAVRLWRSGLLESVQVERAGIFLYARHGVERESIVDGRNLIDLGLRAR